MFSRALEFQKSVHGDGFGDVKDLSIHGKCSKCGGCCSDILPLTDLEIKRLRDFVVKNKYRPNTKITVLSNASYDMTCPFLSSENTCTIYEIRPSVCRLFKCWNPVDKVGFFGLSESDRLAYMKLLKDNPTVVSIRDVVFNEKVPF